jgi:short subunit dehydrogenase-like uncharacterized protein
MTRTSKDAAGTPDKSARACDIILFGATGFTGELTAEYLAQHGGKKLRWGLAGRNLDKLAAVRERLTKLNPACKDLPLLQADVNDATALRELAESTAVVITTVGPYLTYGEPLVAACAAAGTDYVDLTGEPEFVDRMWLGYHAQARDTGARIIHCCGFDSIPHDLGAWFTVQQLPAGVPLKVEGFVRAGGNFSGGTFHSAITAMSRMRASRGIAQQRREHETRPAGRRIGSTHERVHRFNFAGKSMWAVPMPTVDPQIVRRSAAALERYGPDFRYGHYVLVKSLPGVAALIGGVGAMVLGAQLKPTRELLLKLKAPGEGPTPAQREKAWFKVQFVGEGGGARVVTEVTGGDPGYGETSRMLAESALSLVYDDLPGKGGVLTPAQVMGNALIERLQKIGIRFSVVETSTIKSTSTRKGLKP